MSARTNPNGVTTPLAFIAIWSTSTIAGALIGLAFHRLAILPDLERFWIGTGMLAAAAVWGVSVMARAWWEGRR